MGRYPIFMLDSLPVILVVGTALGFLAGLGVGGGSLLILWLTLVLGMEHPQARIINLIFFLPSALITSLFRWKQGKLNLKTALPGILAGCTAAAVCAYCSNILQSEHIKKLFGTLLLFTGVRELLYTANKRPHK